VLDTAFGNAGLSFFDMGVTPELSQFVVRADGRMYLGGFAYEESDDSLNARFVALRPNGALDLSFGHRGWLQRPVVWLSAFSWPNAGELAGFAVDETNGRLHLLGAAEVDMAAGPRPEAVLVPVGPADALDWPNPVQNSAFVSNSLSITSGGRDREIADMYVRSSGKLAVLVEQRNDDGYTTFSVEKRRRTGRPDTTFGTNGTYVFPSPRGLDRAGAIEDQNGSILVAGSTLGGRSRALRLIRITPDGSLDTTFGSRGQTSVASPAGSDGMHPTDIEIDGEGRIVVLSRSWSGSTASMTVTRFTRRGRLDGTFGTAGSTSTPVGSCATPKALHAHGTGYVVDCGTRIVRLTANGRIDARFAQGGFRSAFSNPDREMQIRALTTVGGTSSRAGRLAVVVSAGGAGSRLALLNRSGSLVPSFGQQGSRRIGATDRSFHLEDATRGRFVVTISGTELTRTTYLPTGRRDTAVAIATGPAAPSGRDEIIAIRAGRLGAPVYFAQSSWIGRSVVQWPGAVACQPSPRC
jgi:uncharacterized delta-60 repeat protein